VQQECGKVFQERRLCSSDSGPSHVLALTQSPLSTVIALSPPSEDVRRGPDKRRRSQSAAAGRSSSGLDAIRLTQLYRAACEIRCLGALADNGGTLLPAVICALNLLCSPYQRIHGGPTQGGFGWHIHDHAVDSPTVPTYAGCLADASRPKRQALWAPIRRGWHLPVRAQRASPSLRQVLCHDQWRRFSPRHGS